MTPRLRGVVLAGLVLAASACVPAPELEGSREVVDRFHEGYPGASLELACSGSGLEVRWSAPEEAHPLVDHYAVVVGGSSGVVHQVVLAISGSGTEQLEPSVVEACAPSCTASFVAVDAEGQPGDALIVRELVVDADADGHAALTCGGSDCGDEDATVFPGAVEACDGRDNSCSGVIDDVADAPLADLQDGVCAGAVKVCDGAGGWLEPDYAAHDPRYDVVDACDGHDNDCNGAVDDFDPADAPPADLQDGVCAGSLKVCEGLAGWAEPDYASIADYGPEACDGLDNDCDGSEDDVAPADVPAADLQDGVCAGSLKVCDGAGGWVEPDYATLADYGPETCDGFDNDCDGAVDDIDPADVPLADLQGGVCAGAVKSCAGAAGWLEPDYAAHSPLYATVEACDGVDNTCSGLVDDVDPATAPLAALQQGVCAGSRQVCALGDWAEPDYATLADYGAESCDGLDNDCNGASDDVAPADVPLADLQDGVCAGARKTCDGTGWVEPDYFAHSALYDTVEACDGVDNTCSGIVDDVAPLDVPLADQQLGVCAGALKECDGLAGWAEPDYGLWDPAFEPVEATCDALDNDCDGVSDTVYVEDPSNSSLYCWGAWSRTIPEQVDPGPWRTVAANHVYGFLLGTHTCAIDTDDQLYCWGSNDYGALGDGTKLERRTPMPVSGGGDWSMVAAGGWSTCGVKTDGTLWCWGQDHTGASILTPTQVGTDLWSTVSVGTSHRCAIRPDETLWCWGSNWDSQLGIGVPDTQADPYQVGTDTWSTVAAGKSHTCAIQTDGSLWCWGYSVYGEVGAPSGSAYAAHVPVVHPGGLGWIDVGVGYGHTCAIDDMGAVWCWGRNDDGELGDGTFTDTSMPSFVAAGPFDSVAIGNYHSCALDAAGELWCWGDNYGRLGNRMAADSNVPMMVESGPWLEATGGLAHTCAVSAADSSLWCWGGLNTLGTGPGPDQMIWHGDVAVGVMAGGDDHTCIIDSVDGTLSCLGINTYGQLGTGTGLDAYFPEPVASADTYVDVAAGDEFTCAIDSLGYRQCWGRNQNNQLGDGTAVDRAVPWTDTTDTWKRICAGYDHGCGIKTDDTLWCWGDGSANQLGNGSTNARSVPTPVDAELYQDVACGSYHSCGLRLDGTLWCWGDNNDAQLGDGSNLDRPRPSQVADPGPWRAVVTYSEHTCAIKTDDTLWCWGEGYEGELGIGYEENRQKTPAQVPGFWESVNTGESFSCGIQTDGSLWCWGGNFQHQLAMDLGGDEEFYSPIPMSDELGWSAVASGYYRSCAAQSTVGPVVCGAP